MSQSSDHFRFERKPAGDFPFYNGTPLNITGPQWLIVLAGCVLGFVSLTTSIPFLTSATSGIINSILFFALPLIALRIVAGPHWKSIFRRIDRKTILWGIGIALLNIVISLTVAVTVKSFFETADNPIGGFLGGAESGDLALFFIRSIPQLFGEEVVSILPFLAALWFAHAKLGLTRKRAILLAWLFTALLFGAIHLPTYSWNFVQCFVIIGSARIVLLIAYLATKNIFASAIAHFLNDWIIFTVILVVTPSMT